MSTRMLQFVTAALALLCALAAGAQDNRPQLTNNTSGCDYDQIDFSFGYCSGPFVGMFDNNPAGSGRLQGDGEYNAHVTNAHDVPKSPIGSMVSTIDVHTLLYPGNQTLILAGYQPWFKLCDFNGEFQTNYPLPAQNQTFPAGGYQPCLGTAEVGYDNDGSTYIAQLQDLSNRGFNGVIIDWYGQGNTHNDTTTRDLTNWNDVDYCTGMQQCSMYWALMEDQGSWNAACPPNATTDQTNCIITHLNADFDYMNSTYFVPDGRLSNQNGQPTHGYLKIAPTGPASNPWQVSVNGRPVVFLFIPYSAWVYPSGPNAGQPNADWTTIWNTVRSHVVTYGANEPYLIFENGNAFSHTLFPQSDGGFAWISHWTNDTTHCPFTTASDPEGLCLLFHFYQSALTATESWNTSVPMIDVGAAWKGFDNTYASWREFISTNANVASIISARCGQTWLDTFARANAAFSTTKQLPFLQVATWNDYDEGHEIETGIENCWSVNASMQPGSSIVNWSLVAANVQTNAAANATINTVDHFEIWTIDSSNNQKSASVPASATSFDLAGLSLASGTYQVIVYEVSKPSIRNQASAVLSYTK